MKKKIIHVKIDDFLKENVYFCDNLRFHTDDRMSYIDIEYVTENGWYVSLIDSKNEKDSTILLNKVISEAKNKNIKEITLSTTEINANNFFNKFGFEILNTNNPFDVSMILNIK